MATGSPSHETSVSWSIAAGSTLGEDKPSDHEIKSECSEPTEEPQTLIMIKRDHTAVTIQGLNKIKSVELEMTQLRARFAENYYPSNLDPARRPIESDFQFNLPVRAFYTSRTSLTSVGGRHSLLSGLALSLAVDAISLAGMASSINNKAALLHALRLSQAALMAHREAVSETLSSGQNQASVHDSKILLATQALNFCQQFSALSEAQGGGSIIHIQGLGNMIAARGLENMTGEDNRAWLQYYQQYATRLGLILRRPLHRELEEAWPNYSTQYDGPYSEVVYLSIRLPALLEDADLVCEMLASSRRRRNPPGLASAIALIKRLQDLESNLQTWYERTHPGNETPYQAIDVSKVELLREMPPSLQNLFPAAFKFTSFYSAVCHSRFWLSLLEMRASIAMLLHSTRSSSITSTSNVQNVTECADELCQTIMFFMKTENGAVGFMPTVGALISIYRWYERISDYKKMDWCRRVARIIEARGICCPDLDSSWSPKSEA